MLILGCLLTAVTSQERLLFKKNFFGLKKCGFYSREVTKRERLLMARIRYLILKLLSIVKRESKG